MVLCFTNDDTALLVGDKTGEAYLYSLTDWIGPGGHLLGHFSMLLDMVIAKVLAKSINDVLISRYCCQATIM